jgi:hypothetical protein
MRQKPGFGAGLLAALVFAVAGFHGYGMTLDISIYVGADSEGFCTPVPIEFVHPFRSFCTPGEVVTPALA